MSGLRLALSLLTIAPVGRPAVDRGTARSAVVLAPLVGAALGLLGGVAVELALRLGLGALTAAVLGVGLLAVLTRGLHLDGLADLADGLGSRRPAAGALDVMRRSDIGPFGVATLVLVLLLQVATLAELADRGTALPALVLAAATGRAAVTVACRRGVPAARPDGLGRLVADLVPRVAVGAVVLLLLAVAAALGSAGPGTGPGADLGAVRAVAATVAGLGAALLLERHAVRRLGGTSGDVLGALVETATTTALVVLATGAA